MQKVTGREEKEYEDAWFFAELPRTSFEDTLLYQYLP
jgi:hypothetical protein